MIGHMDDYRTTNDDTALLLVRLAAAGTP